MASRRTVMVETRTIQVMRGESMLLDPQGTPLAFTSVSRVGHPNKLPSRTSTEEWVSLRGEGTLPDRWLTAKSRAVLGGLKESSSSPLSLFDDRSSTVKVAVWSETGISPMELIMIVSQVEVVVVKLLIPVSWLLDR